MFLFRCCCGYSGTDEEREPLLSPAGQLIAGTIRAHEDRKQFLVEKDQRHITSELECFQLAIKRYEEEKREFQGTLDFLCLNNIAREYFLLLNVRVDPEPGLREKLANFIKDDLIDLLKFSGNALAQKSLQTFLNEDKNAKSELTRFIQKNQGEISNLTAPAPADGTAYTP